MRKACKDLGYWPFGTQEKYAAIVRTMELPTVSSDQIEKYRSELESGRSQLLFKSERERLSPLLPLCIFQEPDAESSRNRRRGPRRAVVIDAKALDVSDLEDEPGAAGNASSYRASRVSLVARPSNTGGAELPCCLTCYRLLELHRMRYYALVFHTESTVKELKKHKAKTIDEWDEESIKYLLNLYKSAKKEVNVSDVLASQRKRKLA